MYARATNVRILYKYTNVAIYSDHMQISIFVQIRIRRFRTSSILTRYFNISIFVQIRIRRFRNSSIVLHKS